MGDSNFGLYLEIDSFLDTRLAMVYCINPELAKTITSEDYNTRNCDNYGYMSHDIFAQLYSIRNKNLLELATPTKIKYLVYEIMLNKNNNMLNVKDGYQRVKTPIIYFNTYPYNLNNDEINNFKSLLKNIYHFCEIEMVNMDIDQCNPTWIYKHVDHAIMYYGLKWLEHHVSNGNLTNSPIPGVALILPDIIFSSNKGNVIKKMEDVFEGTIIMYESLVHLEFIYVGNFNTIIK